MSLLKKHAAAHPINGTREIHYATLLNAVPCAPATMKTGDIKERVILTIKDNDSDTMTNFYVFRDAVAGLPTFVPKGGVAIQLTLQDDGEYVNCVAAGVATI